MNAWRGKETLSGLFKGSSSCRERAHRAAHSPENSMTPDDRWRIISAFGRILENRPSSVERDCDLPYPKGLIQTAILEEIRECLDLELRNSLEIAFVQLEFFVSAEEFGIMEEFKHAGSLAQEMARSGSPEDVIASARILKQARGERAVRIQEKISEKMNRRIAELRQNGCSPMMVEAY